MKKEQKNERPSEKELKALGGILKKLGRDGYEYYAKNKELPAVKLTSEELEFVKGGGLVKWLTGRSANQWKYGMERGAIEDYFGSGMAMY